VRQLLFLNVVYIYFISLRMDVIDITFLEYQFSELCFTFNRVYIASL